jgi:hypothetical protein
VHCAVLSEHTNFNVWVFVRNPTRGTSGWAHEDNLRVPAGMEFVDNCWNDELVVVH